MPFISLILIGRNLAENEPEPEANNTSSASPISTDQPKPEVNTTQSSDVKNSTESQKPSDTSKETDYERGLTKKHVELKNQNNTLSGISTATQSDSAEKPIKMKLGGYKSIKELKKVNELKPAEKVMLRNYILKCESTIAKINSHLNYVTDTIKQNQAEINSAYFEIATALLLLALLILGFRVIAFIFDNTQSYKKLPMEAKQERIEEESRQAHNRNLYVASNLQLVIFALLSLCSFACVKMFPFVSCLAFSAIIFYMIFTAILKVFREGKQLSGSLNSKRVVISFVSIVVGIGYALGYSKNQDALCFGLITLLFIVILRGISEKKRDFFSIKNIICIALCGGIIRIHITYQRMVSSNYSQLPGFIRDIIKSDAVTYFGLA